MPSFRSAYLVFVILGFFGTALSSRPVQAGTPKVVQFDAPAITIAEPLDASLTTGPTTGGQLMRLRLTVSALVDAGYRGGIEEFTVAMDSPSRAMRVLDYWPKTEFYSQVEGQIAVHNQSEKNQNFSFAAAGGYEPFVRGKANGDYRAQQQIEESYRRRPPMQLLTSSGTVNRGAGVFFKFRPGPTPSLEGDREVALLVEVPHQWRADLLHVTMQATGTQVDGQGGQQTVQLGATELWTAVHRLGDDQAASSARRYIASEQLVRRLAAANNASIQHRSLPTVLHKLGAALDVVEPKIPANFLNEILFNMDMQQFDSATSRLPVDLRVASLDLWDRRSELLHLAQASHTLH